MTSPKLGKFGLFGAIALVASTTALSAQTIHTGGPGGAYNTKFCPPLQKTLANSQLAYRCAVSEGSQENIDKVRENPGDIGFAQLDVFALESKRAFGDAPLQTIRSDVARECLFMVTRERSLDTFGEIAARASQLRFVLPPTGSGSASTFKMLQEIDPDGLGQAYDISYADSTDDAIRRALSSENTVTLFVQFADPKNSRFKQIVKENGQFVPVLSRPILRQEISGQKVYFADETQVSNASWSKAGKKVITACTPMVLFTSATDEIRGDQAQADHRDMVRTLKAANKDVFTPKQGIFARIWDRTKSLSAAAVERSLKASEDAREAAGPMMEKARERMRELGDKAKELGSQAREAAGPALDKAREKAGELGQRAKELGQDAYDRTKDAVDNMRKEPTN